MAKKTTDLPADVPPEDEQYASFFDAEMREATKIMGRHNVLVGDETKARKYGVELPSLALQYVTQNNVLFMEHLIMLAGRPASHKSSFAFELARWCIMQPGGGFARLYDTEGKYSPGLAENLIGDLAHTVLGTNSWQVRVCETLDQWSELFGRDLRKYRDTFAIGRRLKKKEQRMPLLPAAMIVDSLTGRTTETNIRSAMKDGQASNTQGMRTAKSISDWLQIQTFTYTPWYIVMVRHEKPGGMQSSFMAGRAEKQTPGGKAPDFMGGYDFRFAVVDRYKSDNNSRGYNLVRMVLNKNAFGVDRLRCAVRFSWQWVDPGGGAPPLQVPRWEWDLATAEFLAGWDHADIKDLCHVVQGGTKPDPRFNCKQLGLKDVTGQDLGLAVRQETTLYKALQDYFHIARWQTFDPAVIVPPEPDKKSPSES
jgi:hypothetical protein